jgi:hypothetical protein
LERDQYHRMQELIKLGRVYALGGEDVHPMRQGEVQAGFVRGRQLSVHADIRTTVALGSHSVGVLSIASPLIPSGIMQLGYDAKKEKTRRRRLNQLIADSAHQRRIRRVISNPRSPS